MNITKSFETKDQLRNEIEYWKAKAEEYRRQYKVELLSNQAYSHVILQLAMSGVLPLDAQKMIYEMHQNEMQFIWNKIHKEMEL